MGSGFDYKCGKCGKEYSVLLGTGYGFTTEYQRIMKAVKSGKYGEEWKNLVSSQKYVAVDAVKYLYSCRKCGAWKEETGLSLYYPKDEKKLAKIRYGEKTVAERGGVPYVTEYDLKTDYQILKKRIHKCKKCGAVTHRMEETELLTLSCPKCGSKPADVARLLWD